MIKPSPNMAFIIEDNADTSGKYNSAKKAGLIIAENAENQLSGTTGIIYAVDKNDHFKKGDRVIYSRFVAERVEVNEKDIPPGRLRAVPIDCLLGWIL
jgi:GTPase Era involved in 16S rRNA processing